jgi:hypothetical protein
MFLGTLFLAVSAVMAWAVAITLPAVVLLRTAGAIISAALVRLIKGKKGP